MQLETFENLGSLFPTASTAPQQIPARVSVRLLVCLLGLVFFFLLHAHTAELNLPARVQDAGCLAVEGRIRCQQGREENLRRPIEVLARGNLSTEGSGTFWVFAGPSGCIFGPVGWPLGRRRG